MAKESKLKPGGTNLFQLIKSWRAEAEKKGIEIINLSIGQPQGSALFIARLKAGDALNSTEEAMHEYQDNGSPGCPDFARRFIQPQIKITDLELLEKGGQIDFLPTPGTKSMLGLIPMACGAIEGNSEVVVYTHTDPGYPTPADWCRYLGIEPRSLTGHYKNGFLFDPTTIPPDADLLMLNFPHNPSGQTATKEFWKQLCAYCELNNIRLFNDGAYLSLSHSGESYSLTEAAAGFPNLSWAEAWSASKLIGNGTGWRIGAICGSPDFVGDIKTIKGNTDSGFNAALATGVLYAQKYDQAGIDKIRTTYQTRINLLIKALSKAGMKLVVVPEAGFFTLWHAPKKAFEQTVNNGEEFNKLMIAETGIVGVHFGSYIRYAVVGPVEDWINDISQVFAEAKISY